jgi:hypothetical protein
MGRACARPLLPGNATRPTGVDGPSLRAEANARLRTKNGMNGLERLAVYNRQYWFRLITIFQDEYPCCLHVIGLDAFNAWVIRYLEAHPPASPYLAEMDAGFPDFLRRRYRSPRAGPEREAVLQAAAYDRAFSNAFDAPDGNPAGGATGNTVSGATRWRLAAHVTPLWQHWDFPAYRARCLEDDALTARLGLKRLGARGRGLCLHRHEGTLYEKPVTRAEYLLLEALRAPRTLDEVFRVARRGAMEAEKRAMEKGVASWFRTWTELGWLEMEGER